MAATRKKKIIAYSQDGWYYFYGPAARQVNKLVGVALTTQHKGGKTLDLAGFPINSGPDFIGQLLDAGAEIDIRPMSKRGPVSRWRNGKELRKKCANPAISWKASQATYGKRHYAAEGRGWSLRIDPVFSFQTARETFTGYRVSGNYHGNGWKVLSEKFFSKIADAKKLAGSWLQKNEKGARTQNAAINKNDIQTFKLEDSATKNTRARNTTIIKAKKIGRIIIRKKPSVVNPYAYQIQFQRPGESIQYAGAYYTSSRADALKQAEADLKKRRLWRPKTKLITGAVPLNSTAARHKNPIPISAVPSGYMRALGKKQVSALLRSKDPLSLADKKRMESYEKQDFKKYDTWVQFANWLYARENAIKNPTSKNKVRTIREKFTGLKSRKIVLMNAPKGTPANLAKLGKLISIKAAKGTLKPSLRNPGSTVWLCADSRGKLHLCTTGDRLIDGPAQSFGEIQEIEYEAIKPHLGHKRPTIFFHHMGEEGGKRPELRADGAGGLKIQGGTYYITPEGIRD